MVDVISMISQRGLITYMCHWIRSLSPTFTRTHADILSVAPLTANLNQNAMIFIHQTTFQHNIKWCTKCTGHFIHELMCYDVVQIWYITWHAMHSLFCQRDRRYEFSVTKYSFPSRMYIKWMSRTDWISEMHTTCTCDLPSNCTRASGLVVGLGINTRIDELVETEMLVIEFDRCFRLTSSV